MIHYHSAITAITALTAHQNHDANSFFFFNVVNYLSLQRKSLVFPSYPSVLSEEGTVRTLNRIAVSFR